MIEKIIKSLGILLLCLGVLCAFPIRSQACTGMRVKAKDGSVVFVRSMEFGQPLQSDILVAPKGMVWHSDAPGGKQGLEWTSKYAFMGPDGFGVQSTVEGINEEGLYVGGFWMPQGEAEFPKVDPAEYSKVVSVMYFSPWILGNCKDLADVREKLPKLKVTAAEIAPLHMTPLGHWYVMDSSGKAMVVEYIDGKLKMYDNPVGVMTNAPSFDWHLTNLRNYINLHSANVKSAKLGELDLKPLGEGTGLLGLPGDITPPSRFVRAAVYANRAYQPEDEQSAVTLGMNLIASFAIPRGVCREVGEDGKESSDFTQWTTVYDIAARTLYFRTYDNQDYKKVRLDKVSFKGNKPLIVPMWNEKSAYQDVTTLAQPGK